MSKTLFDKPFFTNKTMKKIKYRVILGFFAVAVFASCKDFQEINQDPNAVPEGQVRIEFLLNKSIYSAQQDPHIAERMFIGNWDRVAKFERSAGLAVMSVNDGWSNDYWSSYGMQWVKYANLAVTIGESRLKEGIASPNLGNVVQMARIWRAYLFSELADNFGPIPRSKAFLGPNVEVTFDNLEQIYKFILEELADASAKIDPSQPAINDLKNYDMIFAGDLVKWQKYANTMRLRYAMRLSNVDKAFAQAQFEAAAKLPLITTLEDMPAVQEKGGWDPTTGVMTRPSNWQQVSLTMNNLSLGLGGVNVQNLSSIKGLAVSGLPAEVISKFAKDPNKYLGVKLPNHLSGNTNVDGSQYFFDAIPYVADPRLFKNYSLPGFNDGVVSKFTAKSDLADSTRVIMEKGSSDYLEFRTKYTWGGLGYGEWSEKSALFSGYTGKNGNIPCKSKRWCDNQRKRVFFGPWETYFLLAEAALYGWNTNGMSDKTAYENGVKASFEYLEINGVVDQYLESTSYNRIGTSVAYEHNDEVQNVTMNFVGLEGNLAEGPSYTNPDLKALHMVEAPLVSSVTYKYPTGFYATNNDKLTKIITQKYIAQCPWLPLEAWSDYRRLGLPFQENPFRDKEIVTMPWYTDFTKASLQNIPGRLPFPQSLIINNKIGYESGVVALGGKDVPNTPLWWAKK